MDHRQVHARLNDEARSGRAILIMRKLIDKDGSHTLELEEERSGRKHELYLVFDGKRIAYRKNKRWNLMTPNYIVLADDDEILVVPTGAH